MARRRALEIPVLESDRLILRGFVQDDLDEYAGIFGDPEVARFIGAGVPVDRELAWRGMATMVGHWRLRGFGMWAVEEKVSGEMIGRAGLLEPEGWPGTEIGWTIARAHWGKGYATEAARRCLRWAFEAKDRDRLISLIRPENMASIRVAEKLGMTLGREIEIMGGRALVYDWVREPA
jgi:RimJ/RimL family protein N-acetyltransferase